MSLPAPLRNVDLAPGDKVTFTAVVERIDSLGNTWIRWRDGDDLFAIGWLTNVELAWTQAKKVAS